MIEFLKSIFIMQNETKPRNESKQELEDTKGNHIKVEDVQKSKEVIPEEKDIPQNIQKGSCGSDFCWGLSECGCC